MKLCFTLFFVLIFLIEVLCGQFFTSFTFKYGFLTIANRIVLYLSVAGLLFCIPLFFKTSKTIIIIWGIVLLGFFILISIGEIHPIDTTTEPIDIATLQTFKDRRKLVVREYLNTKTNETIHDTLLVKDVVIFRRIYKK